MHTQNMKFPKVAINNLQKKQKREKNSWVHVTFDIKITKYEIQTAAINKLCN